MNEAVHSPQRMLTDTERSLADAHAGGSGEPEWADSIRRSAMAQFGEFGLPHRRVEAWKYTDARALLSGRFEPPKEPGAYPALNNRLSKLLGGVPALVVTIVDGQVRGWADSPLAPPEGVRLETFANALQDRPEIVKEALQDLPEGAAESVRALNTGLAREGVVLEIDKGIAVEPVIVLAHLSGAPTRAGQHLRHLVRLGAGASAALFELHLGVEAGEALTTVNTDIRLGAGSRLVHGKWVGEGLKAAHLSEARARLARGARYESFAASLEGGVHRLESDVRLYEPEAEARLGGLLLLDGARHGDITARIAHEAPHCRSEQDVRAVLAGAARGVAQGAVRVAPGAVGTDGHQLIKGLLLSRKAEFDAKPELEILADDVKCSHGATTGELDPAALFYLRSRGLPLREARVMLIRAFLAAGIGAVSDERLRDVFLAGVEAWLDQHDLGGSDERD